jgi:putative ABC transport system permease protein
MAIPLAWRNLTFKPRRLVLFVLGICFAVVLMFVQYGCRNALLDSSVLLIQKLRTDLIIRSRQQTTLMLRATFPREVLTPARDVPGVQDVYPLYLEYALSTLRNTAEKESDRKPGQNIRVIGADPDARLLDVPELDPKSSVSCVAALRLPGRALFDRQSRRNHDRRSETIFGPVQVGTETDLNGQKVIIVGEFDLGVDFGTDGTLLVSPETFRDHLRPPFLTEGLEKVDLGLVRLKPGADPRRVRQALQELLADADVEVETRDGFIEHEKRFWLDNTPIGYVFGFGMVMGFLVGLVICYQILSSNISDNLEAYATLRAIGYPGSYLVRVVLQESVLLAVLGFVPGLAISWGVYALLQYLTDLPLTLPPLRVAIIFVLATVMCICSGLLASYKALQADPAEVF